MKLWTLVRLGSLTLAGCSSEYIISTSGGHVYTAGDRPRLVKDTGMLELEDGEGCSNRSHRTRWQMPVH